MKKEQVFLIIIGAAILFIVFVMFFLPKKPTQIVFSDDPKTWIEELQDKQSIINATKVTKGESYIDTNGQQYRFGPYITVFNYEGWYKGKYFLREYRNEEGEVIMKTGPDMKPYDGIIEGYLVQELNENKHYIYIFLDVDWKTKIKNTTILWGGFFENQKQFDFSNEVKIGIFMDVVEDQDTRFSNGYTLHQGGIYVGELNGNESTVISLV